MTPREELQALLERVERAEGPDRELSRDIYASLGWTRNILPGGMWLEPNGPPVREPADCTASVDAALALVERKLPGWLWKVACAGDDRPGRFDALLMAPHIAARDITADAKTPALALIAALLSALIASPASPADRQGKGPGKPENETPRERAG